MRSRPVALLLLALAAAPGCRSGPKDESGPTAYGDVRSETIAKSVQAARNDFEPASAVAQRPRRASEHRVEPENRDTKGRRDVDEYIALLESPERQRELQIDVVVAKLELPTDAAVGDLGCGPGLFALAFARACPDGVVFASDLEPRQIDRVREKIETAGLRNVVPVLAGVADPHFPPASLDLVFIGDTYHHLEDRVEYMQRLKSTLKPGGRVALFDYKPGPQPVGPPPEHKLAAGVMDQEMEEAGYVLIDRFDTHPHHDFELWRPRMPWERRD
jgi:SAM-dependent methyltransferase